MNERLKKMYSGWAIPAQEQAASPQAQQLGIEALIEARAQERAKELAAQMVASPNVVDLPKKSRPQKATAKGEDATGGGSA